MDGFKDLTLRDGAHLECKSHVGCDPYAKRRMDTAWIPQVRQIEGIWVPSVHADCNHNEYVALLKRTLGPTPAPVESGMAGVRRVFDRLCRLAGRYSGERWSHLETAYSYTGALRRRYLEAEESLRVDGPICSRDVYLRAFLKAEKFDQLAKFQKPRLIFPRSPRYNLELATRLKPFEHWLWRNLKSVGNFKSSKTRVVAKGLSGPQRAALIRKKMSGIPDCVVVEVDGASFESHCGSWVLMCEHRVYKSAFRGDKGLSDLLRHQLKLKGTTKCGWKFEREGARASGDFNTGMGNSLIMLAVVTWAIEDLRLPTADILVDGDNALIFLPRPRLALFQRSFPKTAIRAGFTMTLERPVGTMEQVRFGQSAPVEIRPGKWTMVRDWRKVLSQGTSSHIHLRDPAWAKQWLHGVAQAELALARGVPILWRWAASLMEATRHRKKAVSLERYPEYKMLGVGWEQFDSCHVVEPTMEGRQSFERAFGISVPDQLAIESGLRVLDVQLDCCNVLEVPNVKEHADPLLLGRAACI